MSAIEAIADFKSLLLLCEPAWRWEGGILSVTTIGTVSCKTLRQLENHHFIFRFESDDLNTAYVRNKITDLPSGCNVDIEVSQQASGLAVVPSLGCLLECPGVVTGQLNAYVICDNGHLLSYCSEEPEAEASLPPSLRRLHEALRLWKLLEDWSDHVQDDGTILYFGLRRIAIEPGFSEVDLPDAETAILEIEAFKFAQDRIDIRKEIFKTVLADQLRDVPTSRSFACLLNASRNFTRRLKESLAIYLSEHSPARLQKEAEKSALELSEKLEAIISGLETKSLTVAPALLVAFKEALPGEGTAPLNLVTMFAAVLYGVSMTWSHHSQNSLMDHVKNLAEDSKEEVQQLGLSEDNRALKIVFPSLLLRLKHAKWASLGVCLLSWTPTVVVIVYAFFGNPIASDEANKELENIHQVRTLSDSSR